MADHVVPHFHNDPGVPVIEIGAREFMCVGALPPFDHPDIVAGQGTLGLEIMEQVPDATAVLVPLSGGGLAAGVASAVKSVSSRTKVIGISMARGAAMKASLDAGRPVQVEELPTLADSLGGGIGLDNRLTFAMAQELKPFGVTALGISPGHVLTERVRDAGLGPQTTETPLYAGRAVAALAADPEVARHAGQVLHVADLARSYGFTDRDGSQPGRFTITNEQGGGNVAQG